MSGQAALWFACAAVGLAATWVAFRWEYMVPSSPYRAAERSRRRNQQVVLIACLAVLAIVAALMGAVSL